jgi:hypothetical protein
VRSAILLRDDIRDADKVVVEKDRMRKDRKRSEYREMKRTRREEQRRLRRPRTCEI